jgi:hypothetical protein
MPIRIVQILALLLTALSLVPAGAHFFEFPNKINLPAQDYLTVQAIYRGWAFFGIAIFGALALDGAAAAMLRGRGAAFQWDLAAGALLVLSLAIFFIWTFPVNQTTENWTKLPANWQDLRRQWEYSHVANAVVTFASLICVTLSVVLTKR